MAASSKSGAKGQKIGRHSRNPSSKLQAARTARNRARRALRYPRSCAQPHAYPAPRPLTRDEQRKREFCIFSGIVSQHRGDLYICRATCGVLLEIGTLRECEDAFRESDRDAVILKRDSLGSFWGI